MSFMDWSTFCVALVVIFLTAIALWLWRSRNRAEEDVPANTVILHQLGKGLCVPSISPFVMKLETYLRMADIPYKNLYDRKMSYKGKTPWIQYNDKTVADSEFCIQYLNEKFGVRLSHKYSHAERGIARAFVKMLEENSYWYLVLSRCMYDKESTVFRGLGLNWIILKYLERKAKSASWHHGIGRHTEEEVTQIIMRDVEALSHFLGNKRFLLGDVPCEEDCSVFGHLIQLVWQVPGSPVEKTIHEKYPNLKDYCLRMKAKFWPDWKDRILDTTER